MAPDHEEIEDTPFLIGHAGPSMFPTPMVKMSPEELSKRLKAPKALDFREIFSPKEE